MKLNEIVKIEPYENIHTNNVSVISTELVGTGKNWIAPAIILGIDAVDFAYLLINKYQAKLNFYHDENGNLKWFGYHWDKLSEARAFKNYVNKIAREKKITYGMIIKN